MARCHDPLTPLAQGLLTCATDLLVACGRPVCRASMIPGPTAVADQCCECEDGVSGQLWVTVKSITSNPVAPSMMACAWDYTAALEVGIFRCSIAMSEQGEAPTASELDDEATLQMLDASLLREAVTCCWPAAMNLENGTWSLGSWNALIGGGCMGGALAVTVNFSDCAC